MAWLCHAKQTLEGKASSLRSVQVQLHYTCLLLWHATLQVRSTCRLLTKVLAGALGQSWGSPAS